MSKLRFVGALIALVALAGCGKNESSSGPAKEEPKDDDDGVSVSDYCEQLMTLDEKTAKANGHDEPEPGAPSRKDLIAFCRGMFTNAKSEEPKAYACMADCMMDAESREDEQACIKKKKCLAKAKNKKLFSNATGD